MGWRNFNRQWMPMGDRDPNEENKYLFYILIFVIVATALYIMTFYFKDRA